MRYEHFDQLVEETHRKLFYVSTRGYAYTIDKFSGKRTDLKPCWHRNYCRVGFSSKIFGRNPSLKKLVWYVAYKEVPDTLNYCIMTRDGNGMNCSIENLYLEKPCSVRHRTGAMAGRNFPVIVQEYKKEAVEYSSVREAAKALYVSYQTLSDYLNGITNKRKSVLYKWGRKIYYKR